MKKGNAVKIEESKNPNFGRAVICGNTDVECGRRESVFGLPCQFCTKHINGCDYQKIGEFNIVIKSI